MGGVGKDNSREKSRKEVIEGGIEGKIVSKLGQGDQGKMERGGSSREEWRGSDTGEGM